MYIAGYHLPNPVLLAPMAGVSDLPFRQLCSELGAGAVVSEMVKANTLLFATTKTQKRLDCSGSVGPKIVQIVGNDPEQMALAARMNVDLGAQVIDINLGCPAKKVCNKLAGSALLADPERVQRILRATKNAVDVPVTVKIRTGTSPMQRNAIEIARIAEGEGMHWLTVHGRTRADRFQGHAEYDSIAAVVDAVSIPVIANGDITNALRAAKVLRYTRAQAIMIGRAAQGNPWIFREITHFLATGCELAPPSPSERLQVLLRHLDALYAFYGEEKGVRIARKHIGWYARGQHDAQHLRAQVNASLCPDEQRRAVSDFFTHSAQAVAA